MQIQENVQMLPFAVLQESFQASIVRFKASYPFRHVPDKDYVFVMSNDVK